MLFKAMSIQMYFDFLFCGIPTLLLALSFALQPENGTLLASICLLVVGTHGAFDYLIIISFITPYRRTVMDWLGWRPPHSLVEPTASLCPHCMKTGHGVDDCPGSGNVGTFPREDPETQYVTAV